MTTVSDAIDLVRQANPFPPGSLRELAAARTDELLTRLRAGEIPARQIRPMSHRKRLATAAVAALAAAAAGAYLLATQAGGQQVSPPASTVIPSQTPPPPGTPVASASEADALLSFDVVLPSDATPENMNVYKWDGRQQLQADYNTPTNGLYTLTEEPTSWTVADLERMANDWNTGSAEIVMVGGVHVLVGFDSRTPGGETDIAWIRGDGDSPVITWLVGPWVEGQSFSKQQALSVAADLIGQGG